MQTLIIDVLKVLNDDSEERLDIVAGQATGRDDLTVAA